MLAVKERMTKIILDQPENSTYDEILRKLAQMKEELIVLQEKKQNRLRQALLDAPVWSDADIQDFMNTVEKGYEKWKPEEW
jgi:hypothetical protein